jgi:hypothetical protein
MLWELEVNKGVEDWNQWIDGAEEEAGKLGWRNWLVAAQERGHWQLLLEEAKAQPGL